MNLTWCAWSPTVIWSGAWCDHKLSDKMESHKATGSRVHDTFFSFKRSSTRPITSNGTFGVFANVSNSQGSVATICCFFFGSSFQKLKIADEKRNWNEERKGQPCARRSAVQLIRAPAFSTDFTTRAESRDAEALISPLADSVGQPPTNHFFSFTPPTQQHSYVHSQVLCTAQNLLIVVFSFRFFIYLYYTKRKKTKSFRVLESHLAVWGLLKNGSGRKRSLFPDVCEEMQQDCCFFSRLSL